MKSRSRRRSTFERQKKGENLSKDLDGRWARRCRRPSVSR